ncbi:MAG TPA: hypothetical protein VKZ79_03640 [Alphaproteobacteria bacterium]|nr:hypothetical protein [Alphaproteobacteria bacterium]
MTRRTADLDKAMKCRSDDPQRALEIANRYITKNPHDPLGYFSRHLTLRHLGEYKRALADCDRSMELGPHHGTYMCRGVLHRALGDHARALADFNHARDLNYQDWLTSFGPHFRADTLARLGRLNEALADCELIREDHWMPEHSGLPGGNKQQFIAEIKRRAAATRG